MSKFIAISGASSTGKTSLMSELQSCPELSKAVFSPDLYNTVWSDLVSAGVFTDYSEIINDSEYVCVFLLKLLDYHTSYIESFQDTDDLVFLDCCWIDLLVYSLTNLWCNNAIKSVQEDILSKIVKLRDSVSRIYLTQYSSYKQEKVPYKSPYKIYSKKDNRGLELEYYEVLSKMVNTVHLPIVDYKDLSIFIIEDLKELGYL